MNITKEDLNFIYQLIINDMERVTRKTPPKYVERLQELELKFSKEYEKNKR